MNLIDKIVYYIAQALTAFGLLMFLFLPMISVSASVYGITSSVSYTFIDAMSSSSEMSDSMSSFGVSVEGDSSGVVLLVLFIIAMCIAAITLIYMLVTLITKKGFKPAVAICLLAVATVVSLVMFIICNVEISSAVSQLKELIGDSSYLSFSYSITTGWIGSLIVCVISLAIPFVYGYIVKPNLKTAPAEEAAAAPVEQPKADEMSTAEALKAYKQLLDDGAITQEEYDKKKSELLQ